MTLRIGFVGAGFMAQVAHLPSFARVTGCEIVALAERRPELGAGVARRFGIEAVYPDHRALLDEADERYEAAARQKGDAALRRVELLRRRFQEDLPIREIAQQWNEDPARLHKEPLSFERVALSTRSYK